MMNPYAYDYIQVYARLFGWVNNITMKSVSIWKVRQHN